MRYRAKPMLVEAFIIIACGVIAGDGSMVVHLDSGEMKVADKGMLARYIPQPGDYWVEQSDGYQYLNPKEVFERKYAPVRGGAMTFGEALEKLRIGSKVARQGWNGKGMWLELQVPDAHSKMTLPYLYMRTAQGDLVPWLASQTDMLSNDWEVFLNL